MMFMICPTCFIVMFTASAYVDVYVILKLL